MKVGGGGRGVASFSVWKSEGSGKRLRRKQHRQKKVGIPSVPGNSSGEKHKKFLKSGI